MWTVLLVEDEKEALHYVKHVIDWKAHGYTIVAEARNGKEGLELLRRLQPHLVITDIVMPELDGVELLKTARAEGFDGRFVMLTCMSDFEYARAAVEYGVSSYLLKLSMDGFTLGDTLKKVSRELEQQHKVKQLNVLLKGLAPGRASYHTDHPTVNRILDVIHQHYAEEITLQALAERVALDASYLSDLFKKRTGQPLIQYVQQVRIEAACFALKQTDLSISQIAERVGFANDNYFIKIFKRWTGMTPSEFRKSK